MTQWARDIEALAKEFGCVLGRTRSRHFRLVHPSGWVVIASGSPSDHHVLKNVRATLRRKVAGR